MDKYVPRKIVTFLFAITIMALGVVLSTIAVLGTSPISSVPWVISLGTDLTLGTATILFNIFIILGGVLIMRRDFRAVYLLEIVMVLVFSIMCDMLKEALSFLTLSDYLAQWAFILLAAVVLGFGVALEVAANVTMMPGEYFVSFVVFRTHREFGKVKIAFDVSMILTAVCLSMFFFGELNGVREGTVFAALTVGIFVRNFTKLLKKMGFYDWVGHREISARGSGMNKG